MREWEAEHGELAPEELTRADLVVTSDGADLLRLRDSLGVELQVCEI